MKLYFVYILASRSGVLYVGITNDLERRVAEHKEGRVRGFTARYNCNRLGWHESFGNVHEAIEAEKSNQEMAPKQKGRIDRRNKPGVGGFDRVNQCDPF